MVHSWLPLLQARPGDESTRLMTAAAATIWGREWGGRRLGETQNWLVCEKGEGSGIVFAVVLEIGESYFRKWSED